MTSIFGPVDADGKYIRDNMGRIIIDVLSPDRAVFVVRAVNNFDSMLAALHEAQIVIDTNPSLCPAEILTNIRQAIDQAESA